MSKAIGTKKRLREGNDKAAKVRRATRSKIGDSEGDSSAKRINVDSIENRSGYGSLVRILSRVYGNQIAFYMSDEGGNASPDEARGRVFGEDFTAERWLSHFHALRDMPADEISFADLLVLNANSSEVAQGMWELIKREARHEFESGHVAADAVKVEFSFKDAWERARYLGVRESFCREWRPKGGIELSMIDAIAQAWLQLQFWTNKAVERSQLEPRETNPEFVHWKNTIKKKNVSEYTGGFWDLPSINGVEALEQAAAMADRWQRMYFRAIRNLRDWRRYNSTVTITKTGQVNIATDNAGQVNVSKVEGGP